MKRTLLFLFFVRSNTWRVYLAVALTILAISCSSTKLLESNAEHGNYIVGYLFAGDSLIDGKNIDVEKLTDLNYAFANIINGRIAPGFKNEIANLRILNETRLRNPHLKILISVGGWEWSGGFSDMCLTEQSRAKFINSVIPFLEENDLDGIDIDWEYPNQVGNGNTYRPADTENFTSLLKELRIALDSLGEKNHRHYLITIAAGASQSYLANTQMNMVQQYVDYINLMTYDFYVPGADSVAGHNAPLFTNPRDPYHNSDDASVQDYIAAGVSPQKIVLGVPFYGHVWQSDSSNHNGLFELASAANVHIRGSFKNLEQNFVNKNGYMRYWDSTSCVPYLFNAESKIFISYDDKESLKDKCEFIKARGLKGAMFWEYNADYNSRLLGTLYRELK